MCSINVKGTVTEDVREVISDTPFKRFSLVLKVDWGSVIPEHHSRLIDTNCARGGKNLIM